MVSKLVGVPTNSTFYIPECSDILTTYQSKLSWIDPLILSEDIPLDPSRLCENLLTLYTQLESQNQSFEIYYVKTNQLL